MHRTDLHRGCREDTEDQAGAVTAAIWLCRRIWRWFWSFIDQLHYWRRPPQLEHVMNDHTICVESGRLNYFKAFATDEVIRFNDNQVTSAWLVPGTEQN